ncbi:MAG TPA: hypothetical protein VFT06_16640 [Flavisolibacter sp.]|nr:hypothetical protein [Flavisolibacter sp.]
MENDQKGQQGNKEQQAMGEPNPTLHQPGTKVADYGNVTGGSANETVEQQQQQSGTEQPGSRSANNDTMGNP